jgi:hypothetical protein
MYLVFADLTFDPSQRVHVAHVLDEAYLPALESLPGCRTCNRTDWGELGKITVVTSWETREQAEGQSNVLSEPLGQLAALGAVFASTAQYEMVEQPDGGSANVSSSAETHCPGTTTDS